MAGLRSGIFRTEGHVDGGQRHSRRAASVLTGETTLAIRSRLDNVLLPKDGLGKLVRT
jgi:hypothetical protein